MALLDSSEPEHERVRDFMMGLKARLITTGAVVTEAFYFLSDLPGATAGLASFLEASTAEVRDVFSPEALGAAVDLMSKYTPMDFADATLVWIANRPAPRKC